ncbi:uncharacterized protein LOC106433378 [Brassica napus]|uniref:uncharacterized protein LOC106433378 n=1 Tax=Brassica napus TaxID=3708 RepID=UPI002078F728|nr:uncharacterized protein LOC106433378 [Brassica napus]
MTLAHITVGSYFATVSIWCQSRLVFDSVVRLMKVLCYGRDRKVILDKDCVLGTNLAAHYLFSSDISKAKTYDRAAEYHLGKATPYKKAFFEAVNYLISDNMDEDVALELHSKLSENQEHDYVYGMLAFSLLERGHLAEAEKAARKGYEINKNDYWAHHCLCHVLQTECRFKEAVEFMEACSASWDSCSSLGYSHNWWHVAVCYLEGGSPISKVYMDALGLMLRLDTRDKLPEILDRLKVLADCLTDQLETLHKHMYCSRASSPGQYYFSLLTCNLNNKKQQLMQKAIQLKTSKISGSALLAEAVYEYGKGNNTKALEMLGPNFDIVDYKTVRVLERRIKQRDGAPFLWHLLEKSYLMEGNAEAIVTTCEKANVLESSYFKFA